MRLSYNLGIKISVADIERTDQSINGEGYSCCYEIDQGVKKMVSRKIEKTHVKL